MNSIAAIVTGSRTTASTCSSTTRGPFAPARVAALLALILAGLGLRILAAGQSLFGDELFSFEIVSATGPGGVIAGVERTENTPPLFYLLSWITARLGDPTVWLRAPSVIAGAATVPVVYLLAARAGGRIAGIAAAAAFAIAPFAVFYGSEARAYALVAFLASVSTVTMLIALDRDRRWWAAFWFAAVGALYSHLLAAIVLAVQACWALSSRRDRWREVAVVNLAVAVAFLPWLFRVGDNQQAVRLAEPLFASSGEAIGRETLKALLGNPFAELEAVPGTAGLIALGAAAGLAVAGLAAATRDRRSPREPLRRAGSGQGLGLLALLASATPLALIAYGIVDGALYTARNLFVSLPYAIALVAALIVRLPRPFAAGAGALALTGIVLGAARSLEAESHRPDLRTAGELVVARGSPHDPVLERPLFSATPELRRGLVIYLPAGLTVDQRLEESPAWSRDGRLFVVVPSVAPAIEVVDQAAVRYDASLRAEEELPGLVPIAVRTYSTVASAGRREPARGAPALGEAG